MQKSHQGDMEKSIKFFYKQIGKNVANARRAKGVTQLELANLLGYSSPAAIAQPEIYYKEKHFFSLAQLFKISQVLEVDIHQLIPADSHSFKNG